MLLRVTLTRPAKITGSDINKHQRQKHSFRCVLSPSWLDFIRLDWQEAKLFSFYPPLNDPNTSHAVSVQVKHIYSSACNFPELLSDVSKPNIKLTGMFSFWYQYIKQVLSHIPDVSVLLNRAALCSLWSLSLSYLLCNVSICQTGIKIRVLYIYRTWKVPVDRAGFTFRSAAALCGDKHSS